MKPFLRWAGGKTWLIKHLSDYLPSEGFNQYHEPFLGGGSVFLHLNPKKAFLSDLNEKLIATYRSVRDNVEEVICELQTFVNEKEFYYEVRTKTYDNEAKSAAQFIYLNQTSFNGIYRVNLQGVYNVPYGFRSKNFFEPDNLRLVSKALKYADIRATDFNSIRRRIVKNDLIFLDPPYTVSHNNNGFIKYNQKLFSIEDQEKLADLIRFIKEREAYYILTNAAHSKISEIFGSIDSPQELSRASLIGGLKSNRGHVSEYIFTNVLGKSVKIPL